MHAGRQALLLGDAYEQRDELATLGGTESSTQLGLVGPRGAPDRLDGGAAIAR